MNKSIRINGGDLLIDINDLQLDSQYATLDQVYDIEYRMIQNKNSIEGTCTKAEIDSIIDGLREEMQTSINNATYRTLEARILQLEYLLTSYKKNIDELESILQESQPKEENPFYTIIEKVFN